MEPTDESLALLARMSAKPGVQSTLILSRLDGAIVRADGLLALKRRRRASSSLSTSQQEATTAATRSFQDVDEETSTQDTQQTGEEVVVARLVWRYVKATEGLVGDLDEEDEVRLLRVRTRKNELVVVPSAKFLLVVVHDTPPA